MLDFVMEGVLWIAVAVACGALVVFATPLGRRWRGDHGGAAADATVTCRIHGALAGNEVFTHPTGERVCARCLRETLRRPS